MVHCGKKKPHALISVHYNWHLALILNRGSMSSRSRCKACHCLYCMQAIHLCHLIHNRYQEAAKEETKIQCAKEEACAHSYHSFRRFGYEEIELESAYECISRTHQNELWEQEENTNMQRI